MRRANRADPVTFVRSPTLTNKEDASMFTCSNPLKRHAGFVLGFCLGAAVSTSVANA